MQLTQREFLFLEDALAAERLGVVQFQDLAQHCTDPELRDLCIQLANQNLQHFGRLMRILNQCEGGQGTYHIGSNQVQPTPWSTYGAGGMPHGHAPGSGLPGSSFSH